MTRLFKNLGKSLVSICLAGTLLMGTGCADFYNKKPEQEVTAIKSDSLAVLVIDMQDHWLKNVYKKELEKELPYQADVLDYCRDNNIPVFAVEYKDRGPTTPYLKKKIDQLPKKNYITKNGLNAFEGTDLGERLISVGAETIILMGVYASACVEETAKGALKLGFKIATSKDIIASNMFNPCGEDIIWYKERGIYKNSYKELLSMIGK